MIINFKPWEWVANVKDGCYSLKRADPETEKKQLEEYKKQRRIELESELKDLDMIF